MARRAPLILFSWLALVTACHFSPPADKADGGTDSTPPPAVGFGSAATLTDESSGAVMIPVVVTGEVGAPVSVSYSIGNGTATRDADYTFTDGTLTFNSAETQSIPITILPDGLAESDETVEIVLSQPVGADLALATNTVTISANILPRVNFTLTTSAVTEAPMATMLEVKLNMASGVPVHVDYVVTGTADSNDDVVAAGPITFMPGDLAKPIDVTILQDALNEDPETVIVTLTGADTAIIGMTPTHTLTINDDADPEPNVSFTQTDVTSPEGTPQVVLTVSLNIPSGKTITVPFTAGAGTASDPADYSYAATTALVFPPLTMTQTITINVQDDAVDEDNETVVTTLGTPTNATLNPGADTNTMTIGDDDLACFGPAASPFSVCFDRGPVAAVALPLSINTDNSGLCDPTQPPGWTTTQQQPAACFIKGTTITVTGTSVQGSRPLVLVASDTLTITGLLDVSSNRAGGTTGPASPSALCGAFGGTVETSATGGGGAPGGSFMTKGGDGNTGDGGNSTAGSAAAADLANPAVLRAGCDGEKGGNANAGAPGHGGGALYLVAGNTIALGATAIINASGEGGTGGGNASGGSGAGSGGMIKLFAQAFSNKATSKLFSNGGGGSSGGTGGSPGASGGDPNPAGLVTTVAPGGPGGGGAGAGGAGFAGATPAGKGGAGGGGRGGGGGGGAGGFIESNLTLAPALVSAGKIAVTP